MNFKGFFLILSSMIPFTYKLTNFLLVGPKLLLTTTHLNSIPHSFLLASTQALSRPHGFEALGIMETCLEWQWRSEQPLFPVHSVKIQSRWNSFRFYRSSQDLNLLHSIVPWPSSLSENIHPTRSTESETSLNVKQTPLSQPCGPCQWNVRVRQTHTPRTYQADDFRLPLVLPLGLISSCTFSIRKKCTAPSHIRNYSTPNMQITNNADASVWCF